MTDLKEVLALCATASPGPWVWECVFDGELQQGLSSKETGERILWGFANTPENTQFIALARIALSELAQRVIELEKENAMLRAVVEGGTISLRHCLPDPDEDEEFVTCDGYPDACHQCSAGKLREALITLASAGYGGDNL